MKKIKKEKCNHPLKWRSINPTTGDTECLKCGERLEG